MGISVVASVTSSHVFATSLARALPTGLADDDGVYAFVAYRGTLTPPAGWTFVTSSSATGSSITQVLALYRKTTVLSTDSGVSQTWSLGASSLIAVNYIAVRADSGVVVTRETNTNSASSTSNNYISVPTLTSDRSDEVQLCAADTILASTGSYAPTVPLGTTLYSGASATNYRNFAAYVDLAEGGYISGNFYVLGSASANNGINVITVRLSDQSDGVTLAETTTLGETEDTSGSTYGEVISDLAVLRSTLGDLFTDALSEAVALIDGTATALPLFATAADTFRAYANLTITLAKSGAATDTIGLALAQAVTPSVVVSQMLYIGETTLPNHKFGRTLTDLVRAAEALRAGEPVTLAETLGVALAAEVAVAITTIETLGLTDALTPSTTYARTASDGIQLADTLRRFFAALATDGVGIADTTPYTYRASGTLTDEVGIEPAMTPQLVMRLALADEVALDQTDALQAIYTGTLADGVELTAGYVSPDGSFTTWAMNTRNGAVTEYQNFEFNSFAQIGHKYIGASSTGLYELNGDTDDGSDIVARLKGGYLQFGGTHLSRLKAAYIAARGDGDWVLKIIESTGAEYIYGVSSRDMRSTKVHMGKGQRARYFAWELTSTGQDFDIDTLEFVPIVVQRRV